MFFKNRFFRQFFLVGLLFVLGLNSAQSQIKKFLSSEQISQTLKVSTDQGDYFFSTYTVTSVEVEFVAKGKVNPPSFSLNPDLQKMDPMVMQNQEFIEFSTGAMVVHIDKRPFKITYKFKDRALFTEEKGYTEKDSVSGFRFNLSPTEKLFGGGERVLGMDRRGNRLELYNKASYGYETEAKLMYYSLPIAISSNKYMIVFDNGANGFMDMGATEKDILQFEALGGRSSYLVVAADKWSELATNFTELTGRQPMPPRWALGNISSRMGYHSQKEVESVVNIYRANKIPLDGIVIDLFWFGKTLKGTMGNLDWYRDSFPKPDQMLANNLGKGVKTILITEPFILKNSLKYNECSTKGLLCTKPTGAPYLFDFYFGNTGLLDIFKPQTKEWFWDIYKTNTQLGVSGWWGDLGEPEVHPNDILHVNGKGSAVHNQYGHEWAKMVYEGYANDFPEVRPVILMRSGFVGSQRYGLMPWSGDVSRTWGGLKPQVEISLQMGMQGLAYMSSDLGGFAGLYKDAELYTRWLQYGVFQPVYRTHGQEGVSAEPIYWDKETKELAKQAIQLRYSLMPYNYTLAYENSTLGLPMMRPLFYYDDTPALLDNKTEYFWGPNILVVPVTEKGATGTQVYLPKGSRWIDFYSKAKYDGGTTIPYGLTKDHIPVFVKAGSFIPMVPVFQSTNDYTSQNLQVHYYFDDSVTSSSGYMYEDDGVSKKSIARNRYELINFNADNSKRELKITITPSKAGYDTKPQVRDIELYVYKLGLTPSSVEVGDEKMKVQDIEANSYMISKGAFWNKNGNCLLVKYQLGVMPVVAVINKSY